MNRIEFRVWKENSNGGFTLWGYEWLSMSMGWLRCSEGDTLWKKGVLGAGIREQYTGLNDRSGRKIYEGDIVKAENTRCALIKYKNGHFCIDYGDCICLISGEYYKVIGNIHDNPKLLKNADYETI